MTSSKMQLLAVKLSKVGMLFACTLSMSGCGISWFSSRESNPIIHDYVGPTLDLKRSTNLYGTTASRRLAIVTQNDSEMLTCAEPPPDVGEAFASQIAAGLKGAATVAQGSDTKITGELAAQYGRAVATQIAPLLYRTQGLQLYRDSMYKLCVDRMNNWVTNVDYAEQKDFLLIEAVTLINAELSIMQETVKAFYANVKAGEAKVNVDDVVKILEAQKKDAPSPTTDSQKKTDK